MPRTPKKSVTFDVNPDYRLSRDELSWVIEVRKVAGKKSKTPGRAVWVPWHYHPRLEFALRELAEVIGPAEAGGVTLEHLEKAMRTTYEHLEGVARVVRKTKEGP